MWTVSQLLGQQQHKIWWFEKPSVQTSSAILSRLWLLNKYLVFFFPEFLSFSFLCCKKFEIIVNSAHSIVIITGPWVDDNWEQNRSIFAHFLISLKFQGVRLACTVEIVIFSMLECDYFTLYKICCSTFLPSRFDSFSLILRACMNLLVPVDYT